VIHYNFTIVVVSQSRSDVVIGGERNKYCAYELKGKTVEGNDYYSKIIMDHDDYERNVYLGSTNGESIDESIIEEVGGAIYGIISEKLEEIRP